MFYVIAHHYISWHLTHLPMDKMAAILADDIFKCIFLNENDRISIQISLKFVPRHPLYELLMAQFIDSYMWH